MYSGLPRSSPSARRSAEMLWVTLSSPTTVSGHNRRMSSSLSTTRWRSATSTTSRSNDFGESWTSSSAFQSFRLPTSTRNGPT
jgi:hypothetical protein